MDVVALRLLEFGKVRRLPLREGKIGRLVIKFPRAMLRHLDIGGVVHGGVGLWDHIDGVGVEEAGPEEEIPSFPGILLQACVCSFRDPGVVMNFLGNFPGLPRPWRVASRPEVVAPVGMALLLHPKGIVLAHVGFIGVIAGQLHMAEAVKRPMEVAPEIEVMEERVGLERGIFIGPAQGLEVRLANQRRLMAVFVKDVPNCRHILHQFRSKGVGAVLTWMEPGDQGGACRRAGGIDRIGALERHAARDQAIQVRRPDCRIQVAHCREMLLVGGDEENVAAGLGHGGAPCLDGVGRLPVEGSECRFSLRNGPRVNRQII